MTIRSAIIFLSFALALASYQCPKFTCGSVSQPIDENAGDACSFSSGSDAVNVNLKLCSNTTTEKCNYNFLDTHSSCIELSSITGNRYPGDPCDYSNQCTTKSCSGGYCVGATIGIGCTSSSDCVAGSYCNSISKCDALGKVGASCGDNKAPCENHLACASGKCVSIGSLEEGAESDNQMACKSMYVRRGATGVFECHSAPKLKDSSSSTPTECTLTDTCTYEYGDSEASNTQPCKCGINANGKSYCHPGIGNQATYVSTLLNFTSTEFATPCHINDPWFCLRRKADNTKDFHKAFLAQRQLTSPEILLENDLCVKWNVNRDYWISYNALYVHEKNDTPDGASTTSVGLSIFLAVLFIELALLF